MSANYEVPIDDEDESDIRQVAVLNSLKHFLLENDLGAFIDIIERLDKNFSLEKLRSYNDVQIRGFFSTNANEKSDENVTKLI